jgi:hypothetical protein
MIVSGNRRSPRPPGRAIRQARKTDTPLIVYSDRELPGAVAFECFEPVARQCRQIGEAGGRIEPVEAHLGLPGETRELLDVPPRGKPLGRLVPIADDHGRDN